MVDTLEARGENPLVIIPNKYAYHEFISSRGENQRLDRSEIEIMDNLTESGKLYKGILDIIVCNWQYRKLCLMFIFTLHTKFLHVV